MINLVQLCYSVFKLFPVCAASTGEEISLVLAARYLSAGKVLWDCPMGIPLFQGISGWKRKVLCLQGYRCFSHWALDVAGFLIPLAQPSDSCRERIWVPLKQKDFLKEGHLLWLHPFSHFQLPIPLCWAEKVSVGTTGTIRLAEPDHLQYIGSPSNSACPLGYLLVDKGSFKPSGKWENSPGYLFGVGLPICHLSSSIMLPCFCQREFCLGRNGLSSVASLDLRNAGSGWPSSVGWGTKMPCCCCVFPPIPMSFLPCFRVHLIPFPGYKVVLRGEMQGKTTVNHLVQIRSLLIDFLVCIDNNTSEKSPCEKLVEWLFLGSKLLTSSGTFLA